MDDVELGSGAHIAGDTPALDGAAERSDELEAGASHPEYWMLSPFASKLDVEKGDPVDVGFATMSELRDLFDIFFNRINPLLNLLDPFLHSVSYTRSRSALLTTVIAAFAARLSDSQRDAELAVLMERHWRETLVPEVLLGGYKSVELSQAFLLLSLYGKPTQRLADDRSWQYLGYAIRTGTEIGINRRVAPSESLEDSEQLRRRIRNRWRTWMCLFISDRTLSAQTGRPFTISTDELISSVGTNFHRADWALPQDVSLVSLVQLRRLIAQHESAFNNFVTAALVAQGAPNAQGEEPDGRRRSGDVDLRELEAYRQQANSDLERWKEAWCVSAADEAHVQSLAMADFLVRWRPTAMLHYRHARLYLNSIVLQTFEQHSGEEYSIPTALDCWNNATALIDVLLDDITQEDLESSPNQTAIMATWTAMTALRLTKLDRVKHPWVDRYAIIDRAKRLAKALARAGRSPAHRNGAAGPYGSWLRSVLELYIPESERADHSAASPLLRTKPDVKMDASEEMSLNGDSTSPSASSALVGLALDDAAPDRSSSEPSVAASTAISEAATLLAHTVPLLSSSNEMSVEGAITTAEPVSPQVKPSSGSVIGLTEAEHLFAAGLPLTHGSSSPANVASLSNKKPDASDFARGAAIATMPPVAHGTIGSAMPSTTTTAAAAAPPPNGEHQPSCDPEHNIDMAFDYLTAFNSPSSGFPGGLWQPQSTWGGGMS
ncbi:oxysterol-binding protein [Ceraceosorus bombacis]|uniref:Oxysterol-binding protein n=1 Tax=Ceraceosorus bombacis TaxID=401625 RepID=A0A0P1BQS2_9BASI|nr:oxysterol-binding protein [Ceraceosorus bombacis]